MSRFASLKLMELKPILTSIGAKTSGTKAQLLRQLDYELLTPKLRLHDNGHPTRILSIDMGIKNLAFCVCDVHKPPRSNGLHIEVLEWKRIGVLDHHHLDPKPSSDSREEAFGPPIMSKVAWHLVREVLWPWSADTMLIERQRFRSGGSTAVFEWTLRVNMFESMIWAISRALCASQGQKQVDLWPVNPKQVASFWIPSPESEGGRATATKNKIEKKQKVDLVHKWLSVGMEDSGWELAFGDKAAETQSAFLSKKARDKRSSAVPLLTKLDDLADCLLQAVAWCKWEQARIALGLSMPDTVEATLSSSGGAQVKAKSRNKGLEEKVSRQQR